ncbi:uncharacterized protein LOC117925281 isoform X3 [Vitis riparia]|uniref:uncharacterized protein LOC117925281 isoform X3 n=1 Tax=Vitis riparia TaxID=96939 RepID=UPI00155A0FCA|nr:uncharacterized protein LOC117925281 isoform X3 [Vitis riparia]
MAVLCFLLDLLSISPPLLRDLKQALLQLANFYAISPWRHDRIGLCYLLYNRISSSNELKIAYSPRENFGLRDFHHAVNSLPTDVFFPQTDHSGPISSADLQLSTILSDEVLYSWGGKDIVRKIILLSSCLVQNIDSTLQNTLMEAADKCVLVEFVLFEQKSSHLSDIPDNIDNFAKQIHDLDNCSLQTYPPDVCVLHGLVKRWLQDLKDDIEEPLQARFIFKTNLVGSVNQISCNFSISFNHITDGFSPCQTCRCHGIPLDDVIGNKIKVPSCWVTGVKLGTYDLIENFVKIGEQTMLFLPSFKSFMKLQQVSSPIDFNIIERTNLGSLSEGLIIGNSYFVTPSVCHDIEAASDEGDKTELNAQLFQGLCSTLRSLDQGLVCSSICNLETMREAAFHCYYILYPSDGGPMLLRRLAGSEEVSPIPDVSRVIDSSLTKEIENSIESSLLKMELRDYNPVLHERGFHQKLNFLVKESLQFRSIPPKLEEVNSELNLTEPDSLEVIAESNSAIDVANAEGTPQLDVKAGEDKATATIAEEWEQLIVNEVPNIYSSSCICKPKLEQSVLLPSDSTRQLDVKTSRILERLEIPRQLKKRALSPIITNSIMADGCTLMKKPLIPFQPIHVTAADRASIASKPMKPNFQRKHG